MTTLGRAFVALRALLSLRSSGAVACAGVAAAVTVLFGDHVAAPTTVMGALAITAGAQALVAHLLLQDYLSGGRGRFVIIGGTYAAMASGTTIAAATMIVEGGSPSSLGWAWSANHLLLPIGMVIAVGKRKATEPWTFREGGRWRLSAGAAVAGAAIAGLTSACFRFATSSTPLVGAHGIPVALAGLAAGATIVALALDAAVARSGGSAAIDRLVIAPLALCAGELVAATAGGATGAATTADAAITLVGTLAVLVPLGSRLNRSYLQADADRRTLEDEALGLLRDKRAAQYREDRVRRIIENAADAYAEVTRDGTIRSWNSKAIEVLGWSTSEAIGATVASFVAADAAALDQLLNFWDAPDRFEGRRIELELRHKAGHTLTAELTVWVDESGLEPQMNVFARDITLRRKTEERMQRALEEERQAVLRLQEIDRVKSDFVSSISHELRSPLTSTLGYLELLVEGDAGAVSEEQLRMLQIAQRNAKRLFGLIEDLLTLSRIEEGAFNLRFHPVEVDGVLASVIAALLPSATERGVEVTSVHGGRAGHTPGDEPQLRRALMNVVGNAVKFTPPNGHVAVAVHHTEGMVHISVRDTGIGIPPEEQSKLFRRFFRTSTSVEQQHQGAGLGLTIAKAIIEHHGGTIAVESVLGHGTTVTISLPELPGPTEAATVDDGSLRA